MSENKAFRTYAPKEFATMAESRGIGRARLELAMDRLFRIGAIERGFLWRDAAEGKDKIGLREAAADRPSTTSEIPLPPSADLPPPPPLTYPPSSDDHPLTAAHTHTPILRIGRRAPSGVPAYPQNTAWRPDPSARRNPR